jgi:hypothetical protein
MMLWLDIHDGLLVECCGLLGTLWATCVTLWAANLDGLWNLRNARQLGLLKDGIRCICGSGRYYTVLVHILLGALIYSLEASCGQGQMWQVS